MPIYGTYIQVSHNVKMSRQGHKFAILTGQARPVHNTKQDAEKFYYSLRDKALLDIEKLRSKYPNYNLDFSPDSLKNIEGLYFDLLDQHKYSKFSVLGLTLNRMEELLAIYYGQVYVQNTSTNWTVEKDTFVPDRYYLAVKFDNNFMTIECSCKTNHYKMEDNKRRQALYREFKKHEKYTVANKG